MITESDLDNELVKQKDELIKIIDGRYLNLATGILDFVSSMWKACGYEYKELELRERISLKYHEIRS